MVVKTTNFFSFFLPWFSTFNFYF